MEDYLDDLLEGLVYEGHDDNLDDILEGLEYEGHDDNLDDILEGLEYEGHDNNLDDVLEGIKNEGHDDNLDDLLEGLEDDIHGFHFDDLVVHGFEDDNVDLLNDPVSAVEDGSSNFPKGGVVPSSSSADTHSLKDVSRVDIPIGETSLSEEIPSASSNPVLYWSDDKIDDGDFEGFPLLSVDQTVRLGEIMVIMVCQGPLHRVEEIVTVLALNLRNPEDNTTHMFSTAEGGDSTGSGTALYGIGSPTTIQELEKFCEVEKYCMKNGDGDVKADFGHGSAKGDRVKCNRSTIKELLHKTRKMKEEERAAFFCFLAAFLVKCGVKNREAMKKLWSKTMDKYGMIYKSFYSFPPMPILSRRAFIILNRAFRPGTRLLKTVLRAFLKKRFTPGVSSDIIHALCYTLLVHTSYNGMKMVTLTSHAFRYLGFKKIKSLEEFDSKENRSGIDALKTYFCMYAKGQPLHPSNYLPWCRLFDNKYWSNMSPKAHPSLATAMMCVLETSKPNIWKMKSVKTTEVLKMEGRKMKKKLEQTDWSSFRRYFFSSEEEYKRYEAYMQILKRKTK